MEDEESWAARLREGDAQAFERLVEVTKPGLWRIALGMSPGEAQAGDLLQECYTVSYAALLRGQWDGRRHVAWTRRVIVRLGIHEARRRRRWRRFLGVFGAQPRASTLAVPSGVPEYIHEALRQLPVTQRMALVLQVLEGATQAEIAAALGKSEGAVEQLLMRAKAKMRALLLEEVDDA